MGSAVNVLWQAWQLPVADRQVSITCPCAYVGQARQIVLSGENVGKKNGARRRRFSDQSICLLILRKREWNPVSVEDDCRETIDGVAGVDGCRHSGQISAKDTSSDFDGLTGSECPAVEGRETAVRYYFAVSINDYEVSGVIVLYCHVDITFLPDMITLYIDSKQDRDVVTCGHDAVFGISNTTVNSDPTADCGTGLTPG